MLYVSASAPPLARQSLLPAAATSADNRVRSRRWAIIWSAPVGVAPRGLPYPRRAQRDPPSCIPASLPDRAATAPRARPVPAPASGRPARAPASGTAPVTTLPAADLLLPWVPASENARAAPATARRVTSRGAAPVGPSHPRARGRANAARAVPGWQSHTAASPVRSADVAPADNGCRPRANRCAADRSD